MNKDVVAHKAEIGDVPQATTLDNPTHVPLRVKRGNLTFVSLRAKRGNLLEKLGTVHVSVSWRGV